MDYNFVAEYGNPNDYMSFRIEAWNVAAKAWHIIKVHAESRLRAIRIVYDNGYDNIGEVTEL